MVDVWLFGTYESRSRPEGLSVQGTLNAKAVKWRSQVMVPVGSFTYDSNNDGFVELKINGALVSYVIYLTDLEYQLRRTDAFPNNRRVSIKNSTSIYFVWYKKGAVDTYLPPVIPNPSNPNNLNPFPKPVPTPRALNYFYQDFIEERLELGFDYGAVGGQQFQTQIVKTAGGDEQRNALGYLPLGRWQLGERSLLESDLEGINEVQYLKRFHRDRRGGFEGFRFKDWSDYQVVDELSGIGDGVKTTFQLHKQYSVGNASFYRPILKPVANSFSARFEFLPQGFQILAFLDDQTGVVTLNNPLPPGALFYASFEFDVPVWFESDEISFRLQGYSEETNEAIYQLGSIFVKESKMPIELRPGESWSPQSLQQIRIPLDLGTIEETVELVEHLTIKQELQSGYTRRQIKSADPVVSFNLGNRLYDSKEVDQLLNYFWLSLGRLNSFPFKHLGNTYTVRFEQDELNLKFEAAQRLSDDEEDLSLGESLFSLPGVKLRVTGNLGLIRFISAETTVYFCVDSSGSIDSSLEELDLAIAEWSEYLQDYFSNSLTIVNLTYNDERWLKVVNDNFAPNALYLIFSCEAAPSYHSTLTFTPAASAFETDKQAFLTGFAQRNSCQIIVHSISAPGAAFDIFNGQLFAAKEGLLGYSPALKDYGLDAVLNIDGLASSAQWLNYFENGNIATLGEN